jgi:hypothetical protein
MPCPSFAKGKNLGGQAKTLWRELRRDDRHIFYIYNGFMMGAFLSGIRRALFFLGLGEFAQNLVSVLDCIIKSKWASIFPDTNSEHLAEMVPVAAVLPDLRLEGNPLVDIGPQV